MRRPPHQAGGCLFSRQPRAKKRHKADRPNLQLSRPPPAHKRPTTTCSVASHHRRPAYASRTTTTTIAQLALACLLLLGDLSWPTDRTTPSSSNADHLKAAQVGGRRSPLLAAANSDANRLYEDLMMTYNRIVRPVENNTDLIKVKLSLKLSQLIDVNLKNQMMTTNVWLNQEWSDYKLKWDPSEYGGIEDINVPAEQIWLPDIVLYNSAEGYFAVSIMTKAQVRYDGKVTWNPPAIFRSSCQIDITHFPFDSQNCFLKFGSWTFGASIDLRHINDTEQLIERGVDLSEYYQNVEWDIMQANAKRNVKTYTCCPNDFYPDVTFTFTLRRKPLFYTINLILPCIVITALSFCVFYLPSDSGEKVTLTISILVSLIFFLSVLIETIPSTSLAMPLLGKYLAFTMILITVSVYATVLVLNIHFRTPSTHSMPAWLKHWCIDVLPKYLFMNVPQYQSQQANILPEQLVYLHNPAYASSNAWPSASLVAALANQQALKGQQQQQPHQQQQPDKLHQLDASALHHQSTSGQQQPVTTAAAKPNTTSSSLFLPYLQSEAARRLQIQRSRSSDRDQKSESNNNTTTTTNNSNCDNAGLQASSQRQQVAAATVVNMPAEKRQKLNGNRKQAHFWTGLFKPAARIRQADEGRQVAAEAQQQELRSAQEQQQHQQSQEQESSSSSVDADYQHHNHFQARASICSTNLWRIGPTRRCSMAVPANYPTYYRPLVQVSQHQHQPKPGELATISGCLQPHGGQHHHHYHHHHHDEEDEDDESSSSSPTSSVLPGQTVGALVSAAVTNLATPIKPKARIAQQQQPATLFNRPQQQRTALGPTMAPPPLPPNLGQLNRLMMDPPVSSQRAQQLLLGQRQQSAQLAPPQSSTIMMNRGHLFATISSGSSTSAHQSLIARGQPAAVTLAQPSASQAPSAAYHHHQVQFMPRSRSSDHRLCMLASREPLYLPASELPPPPPQALAAAHQVNIPFSHHQQPPHFQLVQHQTAQLAGDGNGSSHTIGRALGQAYMQQLQQRQPATMQRLSRCPVRQTPTQPTTAAYLLPVCGGQELMRYPVSGAMPRSKSQSALDRRAAPQQPTASVDCDQCTYSLHHHHHQMNNNNNSMLASCHCDSKAPQQQQQPVADGLRFRSNTTGGGHACDGSNPARSGGCCGANKQVAANNTRSPPPLTTLGLMKLISEVDKAIENAMFIAQHIDNLDEFESVKENWKYIAMVIDRMFLIIFFFACVIGTVAIFALVPWSYYTTEKPIDLQLTRLLALNLTDGEPYAKTCQDFQQH